MSNARAVRYRRLALASEDKASADLLLKLADECDRGILCTSEWLWAGRLPRSEPVPKAGDVRARFSWDPFNDRRCNGRGTEARAVRSMFSAANPSFFATKTGNGSATEHEQLGGDFDIAQVLFVAVRRRHTEWEGKHLLLVDGKLAVGDLGRRIA
jgi:hypothetical protein